MAVVNHFEVSSKHNFFLESCCNSPDGAPLALILGDLRTKKKLYSYMNKNYNIMLETSVVFHRAAGGFATRDFQVYIQLLNFSLVG